MTKIYTSALCLTAIFFNAFTSTAQEIKFVTEVINYGDIPKGANGERVFEFTNSGDKPLVITSVESSCGCTIPAYSKEPIAPGKNGEIKVKYDTQRVGPINKSISVSSNAKNSAIVTLRIKGEVK